ncbi:MAG: threonine--tRNA ligase [Bacillota bacterium]
MAQIQITLPDGSRREYPKGVKPSEIAASLSQKLAKNALAAKVDGRLVDLNRPIDGDALVEVVTFDSPEGQAVYRHTTAHVLAQAVKRLFPEARLTIGPAIEDGFYYDFDVEKPFTPEDLERIEAEMKKLIQENLPLERSEVSRKDAVALFKKAGEPYKVELAEELPEGGTISLYRQNGFVDLCAGPHLPSTGRIKAVKLLSAAGAYWRGDEHNRMLQRIYGTAFDSQKDLEEHLHKLEEAKRRDHRRLGKELDIFSIHEDAGPGLIFWHPKGGHIRELIENFWREEHRKRGYDIVYSPHIAKVELWKTSGHWGWYRENMYSPMPIDEVEYLLKPMNCPFHILMFKSQMRSYRDLPLRWAELGTVYRYERSGVLHGLLRVRGFTQDDAHIFCRPDQLQQEIMGVVDLARFMMKSFGYKDYDVKLSVRDPNNKEKYAGSEEVWQAAEGALVGALTALGIPYEVDEGEAKFYGPAIDIKVKDALGRGWQGPTIQCDFNLPERFDISYVGEDGAPHRPVMIHRTVLGSMERFVGGLIEHYAGAFPLWLSPVQARVMPITDRHHEYALRVAEELRAAGLRAEVDTRNEKVNYKIRQAQVEKVPYMLVVGDKEVEAGTVSVRHRETGDLGPVKVEEFKHRARKEIEEKV